MRRKHAIVIAALVAFAVPVIAVSAVDTTPPLKSQNGIDREPPAAIYEVTPSERPGYVWATGNWTLKSGRLVWQPGTWLEERPGYVWVPSGWERRDDKWYYAKGYWEATDDATEEDVVAEETATNGHADKPKKKVAKKRVKKNNYANEKLYPRYKRN